MDLFSFLDSSNIAFQRFEHPPVFTCEEARRLAGGIPGAKLKNLFLRDASGERHFLVITHEDKAVDLKALAGKLGVSRLSFASAERLIKHLGITAGAVSLLALINDSAHAVQVVIDSPAWNAKEIQCHPLVNTSTLVLENEGMRRFLELTEHAPMVVDVPAKVSQE